MAKKQGSFSTKYAAQELGCSVAKVRELIRTGQLKAFRPGKRSYKITAESLEQFKAMKHASLSVEVNNSQ